MKKMVWNGRYDTALTVSSLPLQINYYFLAYL